MNALTTAGVFGVIMGLGIMAALGSSPYGLFSGGFVVVISLVCVWWGEQQHEAVLGDAYRYSRTCLSCGSEYDVKFGQQPPTACPVCREPIKGPSQ